MNWWPVEICKKWCDVTDSRPLVMIRATEFCTRCNLLMLEDDVRCNRELQWSSLPCTIEQAMVLAVSSKMCRQMWRSACMWKLHDLQTLSTCSLNDSVSSIVTSKLRILLTGLTLTQPRSTVLTKPSIRFCALVPITMASVLAQSIDKPLNRANVKLHHSILMALM